MEENLNWNGVKKELWKLKPGELMEKLQELYREKFNLECYLTEGSERKAYPSGSADHFKNGNIRQIRKQIACIKTMLAVKMTYSHRLKSGVSLRNPRNIYLQMCRENETFIYFLCLHICR